MCFSAPVSFLSSGGLAILGGASFIIAKKEDKILAGIPLLFAVQQFLEGVQWLYLGMGSSSLLIGYGFLFFAFIVWPIYVPASVFILDTKRRNILQWFVLIGIIVAVYFLGLLPTQSLVIHRFPACINYSFSFPFWRIVNTLYMIAVFGPLLISSHRVFKWFGVVTVFCAIVSWFFFSVAFISVWCFFAAIVSSLFFIYLKYKKPTMEQVSAKDPISSS